MNVQHARNIAEFYLTGIPDKTGTETQFDHAERVALAVPMHDRIAAYLHDVIEDRGVSIETLDYHGIGWADGQAVLLLTHVPTPGETYMDYIRRIAATEGVVGRRARTVKLADLRDNMSRVCPPEMEGMRKPGGRYDRALKTLEAADGGR